MVDKKITELNNLTGANLVDADEFVVVDISADETKAITAGQLKTVFVPIAGGTMTGNLAFGATNRARFGTSNELEIFQSTATSLITAEATNLWIRNTSTNGNLQLQSDDGSGGIAAYVELDGSTGEVLLNHYGSTKLATKADGVDITGNLSLADGDSINIGTGDDLTIQHTGNSLIDNITGNLLIRNFADDANVQLQTDDGSGGVTNYVVMTGSTGTVDLRHYGSVKLITSSTGVNVTGTLTTTQASAIVHVLNRTGSDGTVSEFRNDGVAVGTISVTGPSTAYNTSSDYRLKENITPIQGAVDIINMMRPCTYTFKSDGSWADGFLAHEMQELHPQAVTGSKDSMMDEEYEVSPAVISGGAVVEEAVMATRSVPDYQGVDYSKLTPILTAALQEALNKIEDLQARMAVLEAT
jgi:hypothetical protein